MTKKELVIFADYSVYSTVNFTEFCEICNLPTGFINDLIEYDILHPEGLTQAQWRFDLAQVKRARTALRLYQDLEINLAGVAVVMSLLDEMEKLQLRMDVIEKHY